MNLYLVLAIALGAISGVVEAPVMRPATSTLSARRDRRDRRQTIEVARVVFGFRDSVVRFFEARPEARGPRPVGAARPRAPAIA